jgi:hypothetical protein
VGLTGLETSGVSYLGTGGGTGTSECEARCRRRRTGGKKAKRKVCYTGTYIEYANGMRKLEKRKIPCR